MFKAILEAYDATRIALSSDAALVRQILLPLARIDATLGQRAIDYVTEGSAATAGIRPGDIISQVGNSPVSSVAQFNGLVAKLDPKKPVAILVRRENASQYLVIKPRQ